jgi:hypothetical protein
MEELREIVTSTGECSRKPALKAKRAAPFWVACSENLTQVRAGAALYTVTPARPLGAHRWEFYT